jgi:hypothetical protein
MPLIVSESAASIKKGIVRVPLAGSATPTVPNSDSRKTASGMKPRASIFQILGGILRRPAPRGAVCSADESVTQATQQSEKTYTGAADGDTGTSRTATTTDETLVPSDESATRVEAEETVIVSSEPRLATINASDGDEHVRIERPKTCTSKSLVPCEDEGRASPNPAPADWTADLGLSRPPVDPEKRLVLLDLASDVRALRALQKASERDPSEPVRREAKRLLGLLAV